MNLVSNIGLSLQNMVSKMSLPVFLRNTFLGMSIVFYCILTFAAYRSCDQILASFTQVHGIDQNVTREEIDRIYMKISNSIGSKTLDNRLVQHRNELHRNMFINLGLENWQIYVENLRFQTEIGKGDFSKTSKWFQLLFGVGP